MAAINAISSVNNLGQLVEAAQASGKGGAVSEEFLTIFYQEMLKQSLKAPSLSFDPDKNEEESFFTAFTTDVMVEQFARQLAKNQVASPGWLPAAEVAQ